MCNMGRTELNGIEVARDRMAVKGFRPDVNTIDWRLQASAYYRDCEINCRETDEAC
jgi:hypothetical protein